MTSDGSAANSLASARAALDALSSTPRTAETIDRLSSLLADTFRTGHKVLICGNGGSACDAAHFAEELTGRFKADRPPLPALACTDPGHITCTANDYGFEHIFSRGIEAYGRPGDLLIVLSTSGNSPNILRAIESAHRIGIPVVGLLGKDGGKCRDLVDLSIIAPGQTSDRIQEIHIKIIHIAIEAVERALFPELYR